MDRKYVERFWSKVAVRGEDDCWEWTAAKYPSGYGMFSVRRSHATYAHRVAWELTNNSIPQGLSVLHRCDNPSCCNPKHLFLGTQKDNMVDASRKNRFNNRGMRNPTARLTDRDVQEIRYLCKCGVKGVDVAEIYKIGSEAVSRIKFRQRWSHVADL